MLLYAENLLHCFWSKNPQVIYRNIKIGNFYFSGGITIIYYSYLIRQRFERYHCQSDVPLNKWRVTSNYHDSLWSWNLPGNHRFSHIQGGRRAPPVYVSGKVLFIRIFNLLQKNSTILLFTIFNSRKCSVYNFFSQIVYKECSKFLLFHWIYFGFFFYLKKKNVICILV